MLARPPLSDFQVGAVALGESGRLFVGVNLEFPGLPLHHSVHAEQFLIANAAQAGEPALLRLAVSAVPCGHCRQFCSELACADDVTFLLRGGVRFLLAELLPVRFRPSDLLDESVTPLLLQQQRHDLQLLPEAHGAMGEGASAVRLQAAASAALEAARGCYAPYTHSASGAVVVTSSGEVFSGGYIESAAFNPSLPPLQAALVAAVVGGLRDWKQIAEVVLVECVNARVCHAATTRLAGPKRMAGTLSSESGLTTAPITRRTVLGGCGCGALLCSAHPSLYQQYFAANMLDFSSEYDSLYAPIKTELFNQLFSYGDITDVVELGTGTGANFSYLAQHSSLKSIKAVDPNPAMLLYAEEALAAAYGAQAVPHTTFVSGRAEALPMESASASAVISTLVFYDNKGEGALPGRPNEAGMLGYPGSANGAPAGQGHGVAIPVQGSGQLPLSGVKLPEGLAANTLPNLKFGTYSPQDAAAARQKQQERAQQERAQQERGQAQQMPAQQLQHLSYQMQHYGAQGFQNPGRSGQPPRNFGGMGHLQSMKQAPHMQQAGKPSMEQLAAQHAARSMQFPGQGMMQGAGMPMATPPYGFPTGRPSTAPPARQTPPPSRQASEAAKRPPAPAVAPARSLSQPPVAEPAVPASKVQAAAPAPPAVAPGLSPASKPEEAAAPAREEAAGAAVAAESASTAAPAPAELAADAAAAAATEAAASVAAAAQVAAAEEAARVAEEEAARKAAAEAAEREAAEKEASAQLAVEQARVAEEAAAAARAAEESRKAEEAAAAARAAKEAHKAEAEAAAARAAEERRQAEAAAAEVARLAKAKRKADEEAAVAACAAQEQREAEAAADIAREVTRRKAEAAEVCQEAAPAAPAAAVPAEQPAAAETAELAAKPGAEAEDPGEAGGSAERGSLIGTKAKRKAALARADAEGAKGNMLDAYTERPVAAEPDTAPAAPVPAAAPPAADAPAKAPAKDIEEVEEDWEVAAEGNATPGAAAAARRSAAAAAAVAAAASKKSEGESGRKKYSRDWLLTFRKACTALPPGGGVEVREIWDIRPEDGGPPGPHGPMAHSHPMGLERGSRPSFGGGGGGGGPMGMAPPPGPLGGDDRWKSGMRGGPGPMGGPPGPPGGLGGRGPPPGVMAGRGGMGAQRSGIEGDKWQRGLQPPPPPPGMQGGAPGGRGMPGGGYAPTAKLHKTASRYVRGNTVSDDPEEEKKQKEIKGLLNKITPEKYETIRDKVIATGIDNAKTLRGLIDQVFDKALTEPTFCEIYATLCYDLNKELPSFQVEDEDGEAVQTTFRRVLLNKCQEEFEEGDAAMKAVDAREKAAAAAEVQNGVTEAKEEEKEDGEISTDDAAAEIRQKKIEDRDAAAAELKARRRALGNIQFIGQLFKQKMLTEKIMHQCIVTLLGEVDAPKREDVECLCKLMATVGGQLDTGSQKGHELMDAYFNRVGRLATSDKLESRLRFLLRDTVDLRANHWVARRKVEGPKTIEEIHKEARAELMRQRSSGPPPDRGRRPPPDARPMPSRQSERPRYESDRVDAPIRAMARAPSQDFLGPASLRPGGGSRTSETGVSLRPGGMNAASRPAVPPARAASPARAEPAQRPLPPPPPPPVPAAPEPEPVAALSGEETERRAKGLAAEFFNNGDESEIQISIRELAAAKADMALLVDCFYKQAYEERRLRDVRDRAHKLTAPKLAGAVIGALVAAGKLDLARMAAAVRAAEDPDGEPAGSGEDAELIASGGALDVVAACLKQLEAEMGAAAMAAAWQATGVDVLSFAPSFEREEKDALARLLIKQGLQALDPLAALNAFLPRALREGAGADRISAWVDEQAGDAARLPAFVEALATRILQAAVPEPEVTLHVVAFFVFGHVCLRNRPVELKGLMRRLLADLHAAGCLGYDTLEVWRYDNSDVTKDKVEAIKDCSAWLDELKAAQSPEEDEE
ncbi:hypothetical protein WJX81_007820 [Elliptochloris bilobata]|uniref:CMP/dCMP-type deaminase domain-containing protein n=1 Tax=Elliptochloris bilobata TaxID=381761 RepID=A0AAW1S0X1_9CHLO